MVFVVVCSVLGGVFGWMLIDGLLTKRISEWFAILLSASVCGLGVLIRWAFARTYFETACVLKVLHDNNL